jgi:hypothetical protein
MAISRISGLFIGILRSEVFDRLLIVDEHHLRLVLTEYLGHHTTARSRRASPRISSW